MTKITNLSDAQLSKAIAEQRGPEFEWKESSVHGGAYSFQADFNCTIPNDIFPIWSSLQDDIYDKLSDEHKCKNNIEYVSDSDDVEVLDKMLESTKSARKMSELILWHYVGDEYDV